MSAIRPFFAPHALAALVLVLAAAPAQAQRNWGSGPGWGWDRGNAQTRSPATDSREGRLDVEHFVADGAGPALGHGAVTVAAQPGTSADAREEVVFEAAVVDQLARAGYDTIRTNPQGGQVAELTITRDIVVPEEQKRSPVSGSMSMGMSNRGSMMGLGVNIDLTKPKKALMSTRLALRIRDRTSGNALWEGRASMVTREDDPHWSQQAIATRLAAGLFERFGTTTAALR